MEILYFLVPISLLLVSIGVAIFIWASRTGQYEDLEKPAHSILYDDDKAMIPEEARVPPAAPHQPVDAEKADAAAVAETKPRD